MSEIAGQVMEGLLCEECGAYVDGDAPGYPRECEDCQEDQVLLGGSHMEPLVEYLIKKWR